MLISPWSANSFLSNHRASRCHHLVMDISDSMWDKSGRCYWKKKTKGALILTAPRQNVCILFWWTLADRPRRGRFLIFLLESSTLKNSKLALELKPWKLERTPDHAASSWVHIYWWSIKFEMRYDHKERANSNISITKRALRKCFDSMRSHNLNK